MELIFSGAAHEVTGSCHCLNVGSLNILVDCGMEQGRDIYENQKIPLSRGNCGSRAADPCPISTIRGFCPSLWAGFRGRVYATEATTELCSIMLRTVPTFRSLKQNGATRKAKRAGKEEYVPPLYHGRRRRRVGAFRPGEIR